MMTGDAQLLDVPSGPEFDPWSLQSVVRGSKSWPRLQFDLSILIDCKKSSIMILDFNFTSASSECSDESVHLQSLARACAVRIHKIW